MNQPGRAFALFKAKKQGPQITHRVNGFSYLLPKLELHIKTPSALDDDIVLRTLAQTAKNAGQNVVLEAKEVGVPNAIVAGELKAVLILLMNDLFDGKPDILYKEKGKYKVI